MFKVTIIVLCTVITAVILQQAPNTFPENPVVSYPYNIRTKPCNRRFNAPITEDHFVPNAPQSLTQNSFIEQSPFLTPDDLLRDSRRSDGEEEPTISDVGTKSNNKNCDDDNQDCEDNVISTTAVGPSVNRRKNGPLTSSEIEERTIKLIKDCITGKKFKSDDSDTVGDTRRSLKDDENHYSRDGSSEEPTSMEESDAETLGRNSKVLLINNPRVCYACTSASNPSCLVPNRRTTIKYCNKDHASCVTKTFGSGASMTVIRDCASSCSDSPIPGLEPHYKKCSVCHTDLCNSAYSIKSFEVLYVLLIFTGLKFVL